MESTSDPEALESEKTHLLSAISGLSEKIASIVKQAREDFKACLEDLKAAPDAYEFISTRSMGGSILSIMLHYTECFSSVGVKTRAEFEKLWAKQYSDQEVREAVEELLENEDSLKQFAMEVDKEMDLHEKKSNPMAKLGQALPKDMTLIDAETGQEMPLETYWKPSKFTWFVFLRHFG